MDVFNNKTLTLNEERLAIQKWFKKQRQLAYRELFRKIKDDDPERTYKQNLKIMSAIKQCKISTIKAILFGQR